MRSVSRLRDKSDPTGIEFGLFTALILIGALEVLQMVHLL
jgi:Flp pilus assembly pilin Flp